MIENVRKPDKCQFATRIVISGLLYAVLFLGTAHAATVGTLKQLASPNGCVTDASAPITGCGTGRALFGTAPFFGSHAVALSPDGKNLYAASFNSDAIAVFARNTKTGVLKQMPGSAGCIVNAAFPNCATGEGLVKPTSVAVSPDGTSVYAASIVRSSVTAFKRSTKTGSLTQLPGTAGCIAADPGPECAAGRELGGADIVVVSPDNRNVYVGSFTSDAVAVFNRNRSTGSIKQMAGSLGCFVETATAGCTTARGLKGAEGMTASPDGKNIYVGAAVGNAVAIFSRNSSNGNLHQPAGTAGCAAFEAAEGCANADGVVGADSMQVSSDNKNLYVASGVGSSVAVFKRSTKSGNITQLKGIAGCFTDHQRSLGRCTAAVQLDGPEGIAVSPDGNTVYVGAFFSSAVTVFDRTSFNGTLTQRAGVDGCIINVAVAGCLTGTALDSANALAISPDGHSVYVGAFGSNAIASFARAEPRAGRVASSVPSRLQSPSGRTVSIPVRCTGPKTKLCPGGISLKASSGTSVAGTIGRGSFSVPTGERRSVPIVLSPAARRYLRSHTSLLVTATLRVVQPTGQIAIFRQSVLLLVSGLG
jgi:DNA-binding beta-propeller fold protein YncE